MGIFSRLLDPPDIEDAVDRPHYYCSSCGEIAGEPFAFCPHCGRRRTATRQPTTPVLVEVLEDLHAVQSLHLIDPRSFAALRRRYETMLHEVRPERREEAAAPSEARPPLRSRPTPAPARGARPVSSTAEAQPHATGRSQPGRVSAPAATRQGRAAAPPQPPRRPLGEVLTEWTAARQADILLYLGAFLLSIAALILVGFQGDALSGPARFTILLAYTIGFLSMGLALPRWERVKEAGAVFVGLGATLVPINFIALRTQVLGEERLPNDVVLLAGATASAALYFALAWRGHGRLYNLPGAAAAVVGWGALGSVLGLDRSWLGAWYMAGAVAWHLTLLTRLTRLPFRRIVMGGAAAIAALAVLYALSMSAAGGHRAQLPVTFALLLAGVVGDVWWRKSVAGFALLPATAALTGMTTLWAAFDLPREWFVTFLALSGIGYLAVAHADDQAHAKDWLAAAAAPCGLALLLAHMVTEGAGADRGPLPTTYALAFAAAVLAAWRWRQREHLAVAPALAAGTGAATLWAFDRLPLEWLSPWVAAVGVAYLVIADRDPVRRTSWRIAAASAGIGALTWAHLWAARPEVSTVHLPLTYAVLLIGWAGDGRRRRDLAQAALPPLTAGLGASIAWTAFALPPAWLPCFVAATTLGYLALVEVNRPLGVALRSFYGLALGLSVALGVVAYARADDQAWQLPTTLALLLAAALWDAFRRRDRGMAVLPALAAAVGGWSAAIGFDMPARWAGAWVALAAGGYLLLVELAGDIALKRFFRSCYLAAAGGALAAAYSAATMQPGQPVQLPTTNAILFAAAAWDGYRRRDLGLALVPPLGALLAAGLLWWAGVDPVWWAYPGLAAAAVVLLAEPWWRRQADLRPAGWLLALLPALSLPLVWMALYQDHPAHGVAAHGMAAALLLVAALRTGGYLWRVLLGIRQPEAAVERRTLVQFSAAQVLIAGAYVNASAGVTGPERGWMFIGLGLAAWLAIAVAGRRFPSLLGTFAPVALASHTVAATIAIGDPAMLTAVFAAGAAGTLAAFPATRRWALLAGAVAAAAVAVAAFWAWRELAEANLPITYAALSAILWGSFTWARGYGRDERGVVISLLSWGPWAVALAAALAVIARRAGSLPAGAAIVETRAWMSLALVVALAATAVTAEGARLRRRPAWIGGTAGLLLALLLLIATERPGNVQAYTVPVGIYLVVIGLLARRSQPLFGPNLAAHEAVLVLGLLVLTLPPAWQSFAPGGGRFGLELIAMGVLFLVGGMLLSARWLVAGGVLTLSGVAVRWLTIFSASAPYWITLGLVGTLLVVAGVVLLLQRERWERWLHSIAGWWATPRGGGMAPHGRQSGPPAPPGRGPPNQWRDVTPIAAGPAVPAAARLPFGPRAAYNGAEPRPVAFGPWH